jgi:hypothetical protein
MNAPKDFEAEKCLHLSGPSSNARVRESSEAADAVRTFFSSGMDALVIGGLLVEK